MTSKQDYPGVMGRVPLVVGDDLEAAINSGLLTQLKLTIQLRGAVQEEALLFRLNGETLTDGEFMATDAEKSEYQVSYLVTAPPLKTGKNFIEWLLTNGWDRSTVQLYGITLKVEYKSGD